MIASESNKKNTQMTLLKLKNAMIKAYVCDDEMTKKYKITRRFQG